MIATPDRDDVVRCPKCGRKVESLQCGHCGSQLPDWQADLYGATIRQIAQLGGGRAEAASQRGCQSEAGTAKGGSSGDGDQRIDNGSVPSADQVAARDPELQKTETPPSLCQWIFERLTDANVFPETILDPCAGRGNLTRPFRPRAQVIEYEIDHGRDFFRASAIACQLAICNPPWADAEYWLRWLVGVVGNRTPIVFMCPLLFFEGYKDAPVRRYLESPEAPVLNSITPLPSDTFVRVYNKGAICWFNLPSVRNVALVPSRYLIRSNNVESTGSSS